MPISRCTSCRFRATRRRRGWRPCAARGEAHGVHVGDHDLARAGFLGDGRGHAADGPGAGDEHVLADQSIAGWCAWRCRAIEAREYIKRDRGSTCTALLAGCTDIRRTPHRGSRPHPSCPCRGGAGRQGSCGTGRTQCGPRHRRGRRAGNPGRCAGLNDFTDELVADHHRRLDGLLGPGIPVVDWTSVPQMEVFLILMSTSLMPGCGTGTSMRSRPGPAGAWQWRAWF